MRGRIARNLADPRRLEQPGARRVRRPWNELEQVTVFQDAR
jgi:hypothetical protein